ncbi:MAG: FAD-dependent monooxygenase, partial [Thiotrichales bacterium]|nr:FAD-dependent monooxygenase [Thiotrichales bacterium]
MNVDHDIIIVGAGMVGASLAQALKGCAYSIGMVEAVERQAHSQPSFDDRHLALSLSSQRILSALGLWQSVAPNATAIRRIHVSDQHRPGMVRMSAQDLGVDALGYVVVARDLGQTLLDGLQDNIQALFCPASVSSIQTHPDRIVVCLSTGTGTKEISCRLLILADGSRSETRSMCQFNIRNKVYGQTAIVANVIPELAHEHTAFERFTTNGPFALLPSAPERMAMVFT